MSESTWLVEEWRFLENWIDEIWPEKGKSLGELWDGEYPRPGWLKKWGILDRARNQVEEDLSTFYEVLVVVAREGQDPEVVKGYPEVHYVEEGAWFHWWESGELDVTIPWDKVLEVIGGVGW